MQGFVIKTKAYGVSILCTECMATQVSPSAVEEHMPLDARLERTVECYNCEAEIDGEKEEPKPQSFTVTVEVVVYADDDVQTAVDASDYVVDILAGYFDHSEATEAKEHF